MRITYDILLSLTINHLYFSDKVFEGFEMMPDKQTDTLINEMKLTTKQRGNTWSLFMQTDGPFATDPASLVNKELLFQLKITDPLFYSITDADYMNGEDEMLVFSAPINSVLVPEKRDVHSLKFNYVINHNARPVNIKVTPFTGGPPIIDEVVMDSAPERALDFTKQNNGRIFNIAEDTLPPSNIVIRKIFVSELSNKDVFHGMVYFKILAANGNAGVNSYKIEFKNG